MHRPEDTGPRRRRSAGGKHGRRAEPTPPPPAPEPTPDAADDDPMYVFSREDARRVDRLCVEEFGIPSIVLMENASLGLATVARDMVADLDRPPVLVLAGPGNNGGDGLATARHLANDGYPVAVVLAAADDHLSPDAAINLHIARKMGIPIMAGHSDAGRAVARALEVLGPPGLVIDALLGTGLDRAAAGTIGSLIEACNTLGQAGARVMAVDVPSGLDADTGEPALHPDGAPGPVVRADITVALLGVKPGYLTLAAQAFLGDCLVAGIGAPTSLIQRLGRPLPADGDDRPGDEPAREPRPDRRGPD